MYNLPNKKPKIKLMKSKVTNINCDNSIDHKHSPNKKRKEKIKVYHSLREFYTDSGLIDEFDIEVAYSNEQQNNSYGVTEEDLDNPNFWLDL